MKWTVRDKILIGFLLLAGFSPFLGRISNGQSPFLDIGNVLFGSLVNMVGWFLIIRFIFWVYDKLKKLRQ